MAERQLSSTQRFNKYLMYIGTTCWIAWNIHLLILCPDSSVAIPHESAPWEQSALIIGYVLGSLVLIIGERKMARNYSLSHIVIVLTLLCAMTTVLLYATQALPVWMHISLLIILGCLTLIMTIIWMCIVCVRSSQTIYRSMGGTTACGSLLAILVALCNQFSFGLVLLIVVLLASFICFVFATESTLGADVNLLPQGENTNESRSVVIPKEALLAGGIIWAVVGFGIVLFSRIIDVKLSFQFTILLVCGAFLAALCFLLIGHVFRKADKLGFVVLGLMTAMLGAGLYMLQAIPPFSVQLAGMFVAAGCLLFHLYGKVLYLDISFQTTTSPLIVFAQGSLVNYAATLIGAGLALLLPSISATEDGRSLAVLFLLIVLVAANIFFFSRKSMGTRWGLVARKMSMPLNARMSDLDRFAASAQVIAKEAGFTPREIEVFTLLMEGYRAKQIEEKLGISLGTVRNHLNRGYAKLGVHSYEEARLLVQENLSD